MPQFDDYRETTAPSPSDILLVSTAQGTRKLTIANLLNRGTEGTIPKFAADGGLRDTLLRETDGRQRLLYGLSEPILTGGTGMHAETFTIPATVSISGNIAARAINSEFYFENSWTNQNTMAIRNTVPGNGSFSTLRVLERGGWEMGSFGYGNTAISAEETAAYPWYESIYIESGNPNPNFPMHDVDGNPFPPTAPSPIRFVQSGVFENGWARERGYFYVRQEFVPNGDIHFYDISVPFNQRTPALKIGWDGRLTIRPHIDGEAMTVQNRAIGGHSAIRFLSDAGHRIGALGYGNAQADELANTFYIVAENRSPASLPPALRLMQRIHGESDSVLVERLTVTPGGRVAQAVMAGEPDDAEFSSESMAIFYFDESVGQLMVKVRLPSGKMAGGVVAALD
ncbi:MAG: hypothetical protein IT323_08895 [Anaerolineae bacterium]|nr:hypothetical protein [Anaerolineae bacterium]